MNKRPVILAITGASGCVYGLRLLECLLNSGTCVELLVSSAAHSVAAVEMDAPLPKQTHRLAEYFRTRFSVTDELLRVYGTQEWSASVASGSSLSRAMVICPCSSGTLAAVATGASNNLIERSADVMIKERRTLIVVPRETPLSSIHLQNMLTLSNQGVVILPAMPGFYHQPKSINALVDFVVGRILDHLGISHVLVPRWLGKPLESEAAFDSN